MRSKNLEITRYVLCPAPRGFLDAGNLYVIPLSSDSCTLQEGVIEVLPLFSGKKFRTGNVHRNVLTGGEFSTDRRC